MEKYAAKCKIQNFMSKLNLHFVFWNLDLYFSIMFCILKFSRVTKNWVEDAITVSVKKKKTCWILKIWKIHSVKILPL